MKYQNIACIRLEWLHFWGNEPRELDRKNVKRLKLNFQKNCDQLNIKNHIPAVIKQQHLDAALQTSGILPATLLSNPEVSYPELNFPAGYQLKCLHSWHRIQAGKEILSLRDKWWTVDLYLISKMHVWWFKQFNSSIKHQLQTQNLFDWGVYQ